MTIQIFDLGAGDTLLVGNSGAGKSCHVTHLINGADSQELQILVSTQQNYEYKKAFIKIKLSDFTGFLSNGNQMLLVDDYDFYDKPGISLVPYLEKLSVQLAQQDKTSRVYLDDCPLMLQQEVVTYLSKNKFTNINVVITCQFLGDLPGVEQLIAMSK